MKNSLKIMLHRIQLLFFAEFSVNVWPLGKHLNKKLCPFAERKGKALVEDLWIPGRRDVWFRGKFC